jgi:hypothetical protein
MSHWEVIDAVLRSSFDLRDNCSALIQRFGERESDCSRANLEWPLHCNTDAEH